MSTIFQSETTTSTIGEIHKFPRLKRLHMAIVREDDGRFSVIVLNLPGAGSCGDTEAEAVENAKEAVHGLMESYNEDHEDIPWASVDEYVIPESAKQKWILVNG